MSAKPKNKRWKKIHTWVGIVIAVLVLPICLSGLVLNHRTAVEGIDIDRKWLPSNYSIDKYNNGVLRGAVAVGSDSLLLFGNAGMWLSDSAMTRIVPFNEGMPDGSDLRNIRNAVAVENGVWCAALRDVYRLHSGRWERVPLPGNDERMADITASPDGRGVVAMTRSEVYTMNPDGSFSPVRLKPCRGLNTDNTLFRTLWHLHSGEAFGLWGRLAVDAVAVIFILLSVTGIVVFIIPRIRSRKARRRPKPKAYASHMKWHNRVGVWTIAATVFVAVTGMCLRPPLMIPAVLVRVPQIPGTSLASTNPWHDRLRALRWDPERDEWIISTSEGFVRADRSFDSIPKLLDPWTVPPVSPMGVTVFQRMAPGKWLIGSFSGMYIWNTTYGQVTDWFTGYPVIERKSGRPISDHLVCGIVSDAPAGGMAVVDYRKGAETLPPMPQSMKQAPMSLWNAALEVHVGRAYDKLLGPLSSLYVFVSGTLLVLVLLSGWAVRLRKRNAHKESRRE